MPVPGGGIPMSSFDVRIFAIRRRPGRRVFEVRWRVAGQDRSRSFMTRALADSYRAELVRAARRRAPARRMADGPAWRAPRQHRTAEFPAGGSPPCARARDDPGSGDEGRLPGDHGAQAIHGTGMHVEPPIAALRDDLPRHAVPTCSTTQPSPGALDSLRSAVTRGTASTTARAAYRPS